LSLQLSSTEAWRAKRPHLPARTAPVKGARTGIGVWQSAWRGIAPGVCATQREGHAWAAGLLDGHHGRELHQVCGAPRQGCEPPERACQNLRQAPCTEQARVCMNTCQSVGGNLRLFAIHRVQAKAHMRVRRENAVTAKRLAPAKLSAVCLLFTALSSETAAARPSLPGCSSSLRVLCGSHGDQAT